MRVGGGLREQVKGGGGMHLVPRRVAPPSFIFNDKENILKD